MNSFFYKQLAGLVEKPDYVVDKFGGPQVAEAINLLLFFVGAIAVVAIVYAGFTYATSAGDQAKVSRAKNIIIGSVTGLVIAVMAYTIVKLTIDKAG